MTQPEATGTQTPAAEETLSAAPAEAAAAEATAATTPEEAPAVDPTVELKAQIELLKKENSDLKEQVLRNYAELENFKKRNQAETLQRLKFASEGLIREILPALDNLERALSHASDYQENEHLKNFIQGIEMVRQHLFDSLKKHHVERTFPLGEPFNPNRHEAVGMVASEEYQNDQVAVVLQPGYTMHERVIRPAMVQVCKK